MADEPLDKQIFTALGEAVLAVQERFRAGHTVDEIVPVLIEELVALAYYAARDNAEMDQLAFIGLCAMVALNTPEGPVEAQDG